MYTHIYNAKIPQCASNYGRLYQTGPEKHLSQAPTCIGKRCGDTCKAGTAGSVYGRCDDRGWCVPPDVNLPCDMHNKQASGNDFSLCKVSKVHL